MILCQYVGCCGVAGDPEVFAGKVRMFWQRQWVPQQNWSMRSACTQLGCRLGPVNLPPATPPAGPSPAPLLICGHPRACSLSSCTQVVSTVIGSTISILFGWLILPWYGSQRMLEDQTAALRAALGLQRRCE